MDPDGPGYFARTIIAGASAGYFFLVLWLCNHPMGPHASYYAAGGVGVFVWFAGTWLVRNLCWLDPLLEIIGVLVELVVGC